MTAAVRAAATNPEPAVLARLEELPCAGTEVDPGDDPVFVVEVDVIDVIDVALNECIGAVGEDLVSQLDGLADELAAVEL